MNGEIDPLAEVGKTWNSVVSFIAPWAAEDEKKGRGDGERANVTSDSNLGHQNGQNKPPPPQKQPLYQPPQQQVAFRDPGLSMLFPIRGAALPHIPLSQNSRRSWPSAWARSTSLSQPASRLLPDD